MTKERDVAGVSVKLDRRLKDDFERTLGEIGLSMSAGLTAFAKAVVRTGGMPFELVADPFERREMQDELARRIAERDSGRSRDAQVVKTMEELAAEVYG